ncbi:MAG: hypothetical protein K2K19_12380, partial [Acetatifactor sp.]|nr:hypothetical protein [Acetatifactor sp.]
VYEDGKYYPIMKVVPQKVAAGKSAAGELWENRGEDRAPEDTDQQTLEDCFGRLLLADRHPVLRQYLLMAQEKNQQILNRLQHNATDGGRTAGRIGELWEEQRLISLALAQFGTDPDL